MITKERSRQKPWTLDDVKGILDGKEADEKKLYTQDRNGLSPVSFAALQAAKTADSLTPLLELLEPPTEEEKDKVDQIIMLLERITQNQTTLHQRMLALESAVSGRDVRSLGKVAASIIRVPNTKN